MNHFEHGQVIVCSKNVVRTGHTFVGWFNDNACTTPFVEGTVATKNTVLYAKFEKMSSLSTSSSAAPSLSTSSTPSLGSSSTASTVSPSKSSAGGGDDDDSNKSTHADLSSKVAPLSLLIVALAAALTSY